MDLASVVAALASVGVRVSGSTPNNNIQGDSSRACPTGLAGPEPSGTHNDPGQHFHRASGQKKPGLRQGPSAPLLTNSTLKTVEYSRSRLIPMAIWVRLERPWP